MILPPGYGFEDEVLRIAMLAYFAARNTERALVRSMFMNPAESSSQNTFPEEIPAFAKKTSSRPYVSRASCTTFLTEGSSAASKTRVWMSTEGYRLASSRLCRSRCEEEKSQMYTARAPWRANWWAEARPMPMGELAPVMIMTLSLTLLFKMLARKRLSLRSRHAYLFPKSPATLRIPGMPSNASEDGIGSESSLLKPEGLTLGTAVGIA